MGYERGGSEYLHCLENTLYKLEPKSFANSSASPVHLTACTTSQTKIIGRIRSIFNTASASVRNASCRLTNAAVLLFCRAKWGTLWASFVVEEGRSCLVKSVLMPLILPHYLTIVDDDCCWPDIFWHVTALELVVMALVRLLCATARGIVGFQCGDPRIGQYGSRVAILLSSEVHLRNIYNALALSSWPAHLLKFLSICSIILWWKSVEAC